MKLSNNPDNGGNSNDSIGGRRAAFALALAGALSGAAAVPARGGEMDRSDKPVSGPLVAGEDGESSVAGVIYPDRVMKLAKIYDGSGDLVVEVDPGAGDAMTAAQYVFDEADREEMTVLDQDGNPVVRICEDNIAGSVLAPGVAGVIPNPGPGSFEFSSVQGHEGLEDRTKRDIMREDGSWEQRAIPPAGVERSNVSVEGCDPKIVEVLVNGIAGGTSVGWGTPVTIEVDADAAMYKSTDIALLGEWHYAIKVWHDDTGIISEPVWMGLPESEALTLKLDELVTPSGGDSAGYLHTQVFLRNATDPTDVRPVGPEVPAELTNCGGC